MQPCQSCWQAEGHEDIHSGNHVTFCHSGSHVSHVSHAGSHVSHVSHAGSHVSHVSHAGSHVSQAVVLIIRKDEIREGHIVDTRFMILLIQ
jgi:hypothetical protein